MKRLICWLFGIQTSDHEFPETIEQWTERYPNETLRLNVIAIHLLPRLPALQAKHLTDMKRELKKWNSKKRCWSAPIRKSTDQQIVRQDGI